jgi:dihydrofolate reductase
MRAVNVTMNVSLDGVVQGPGRPDEDTRGGFTHGGWGAWYQDEGLAREMAKRMSGPGHMLFGRRTWQDFIRAWAQRDDGNPYTSRMNAVTKYVVSRTLDKADAWQNSVAASLLRGADSRRAEGAGRQ